MRHTWCSDGIWQPSDINLKKNIKNIDESRITHLELLNAIEYKMNLEKMLQTTNSDTSDISKPDSSASTLFDTKKMILTK